MFNVWFARVACNPCSAGGTGAAHRSKKESIRDRPAGAVHKSKKESIRDRSTCSAGGHRGRTQIKTRIDISKRQAYRGRAQIKTRIDKRQAYFGS